MERGRRVASEWLCSDVKHALNADLLSALGRAPPQYFDTTPSKAKRRRANCTTPIKKPATTREWGSKSSRDIDDPAGYHSHPSLPT